MEQENLKNLLGKTVFTPEQCVSAMMQLLHDVNVLHSGRLAHGSICPENVLTDGRVFTLAKVDYPDARTPSDALGGDMLDADLYALGIVLYCLYSSKQPEEFPSIDPGIIKNRFYRRLNTIVLTACSPEALDRYSSARQFFDALNAVRVSMHRFRCLKLLLWMVLFVLFLMVVNYFYSRT